MTGRIDAPGIVVVRGAGDIATGAIQRLFHAGFGVVVLDIPLPSAIRWRASLCPALPRGRWQVEDMLGVRADTWDEAFALVKESNVVPVMPDPDANVLEQVRPWAVVDAILAKYNLGTHRGMAPVTVGLGPGFTAGVDVDYVVETMRGHDLGRVITSGVAIPNTGVPGLIAGRAHERVLHAPIAGTVEVVRGLGSIVEEGEVICRIHGDDGDVADVTSVIKGVVRGMIPDGFWARHRLKIADVDPRLELVTSIDTISDKSRAVGGATLDAVLQGLRREGLWDPRSAW